MDFPCGSAGKESTLIAGDLGLIPGLGRSPGEGKGYPLQYSGLENSMDCIVHGVAKSWTQLSDFHFTSSILAWEISWTEEPGRLQSMGLQSWTRQNSYAPSSFLPGIIAFCCRIASTSNTIVSHILPFLFSAERINQFLLLYLGPNIIFVYCISFLLCCNK